MASPLAASLVSLTKAQKMAGVCLANIGSETLSIIVFDNDTPISLKVFPVGSGDITNMIALQFQLPLSEAEQLKRGGVTGGDIPQKKSDTIVTARLKDMFTLINGHLKTIGRQKLLPAGIVITGGGSGSASATEIAKAVLKLPSQVGQIANVARTASTDATWAVAYGLCRWAFAEDASDKGTTLGDVLSGGWNSLKASFRSLLP
jgi:cell division protein FtsA